MGDRIEQYLLDATGLVAHLDPGVFSQAAVTGSGSHSSYGRYIFVSAGAVAGSTALRRTSTMALSRGVDPSIIKFANLRYVSFRINRNRGTANGKSWGFLGISVASPPAGVDPVTPGVGFRIDNNALKGIAYKTSLTEVDLSTTLTEKTIYDVSIVLDGAGNTTWYVDGVSVGTTDQAPVANSAANEGGIALWTTNGADAADCRLDLHDFSIWITD
jgi:hypothetical protein